MVAWFYNSGYWLTPCTFGLIHVDISNLFNEWFRFGLGPYVLFESLTQLKLKMLNVQDGFGLTFLTSLLIRSVQVGPLRVTLNDQPHWTHSHPYLLSCTHCFLHGNVIDISCFIYIRLRNSQNTPLLIHWSINGSWCPQSIRFSLFHSAATFFWRIFQILDK